MTSRGGACLPRSDTPRGGYKNAQARAANHARAKGHRVEGELGIHVVYQGGGTL